jgi:hypothetical protein
MQVYTAPDHVWVLALPFLLQLLRRTSLSHLLVELLALAALLSAREYRNYCNKAAFFAVSFYLLVLNFNLLY